MNTYFPGRRRLYLTKSHNWNRILVRIIRGTATDKPEHNNKTCWECLILVDELVRNLVVKTLESCLSRFDGCSSQTPYNIGMREHVSMNSQTSKEGPMTSPVVNAWRVFFLFSTTSFMNETKWNAISRKRATANRGLSSDECDCRWQNSNWWTSVCVSTMLKAR